MARGQGQGREQGGASAHDQGGARCALHGVLSEARAGQVLAHAGQHQTAEPAENRGEDERRPRIAGNGCFKERGLKSQAQDEAHGPEGPDVAVLDDGPEALARRAAAPSVPQIGPAVPVQAPGQVDVEPGQNPGQDPGREREPGAKSQDQPEEQPYHRIHGHGFADGLGGGDMGAAQAGQESQGHEEVLERVHRCGVSFRVRRMFRPGARPRVRAQSPWFTASSSTP